MCYYNMFGKKVSSMLNILLCSDAGTEGARGTTAHPNMMKKRVIRYAFT